MKFIVSIFCFLVAMLQFTSCRIQFNDKVKEIDSEYFNENICKIINPQSNEFRICGNRPHIIYFYDDYVQNCRAQAEVFDKLAQKYFKVFNFYVCNVSENDTLAKTLGIKSKDKLPVLAVFPVSPLIDKYELVYFDPDIYNYETTELRLKQIFN